MRVIEGDVSFRLGFLLWPNINHSQIKTPRFIDDLVSFVVATQIAAVHLVTCGRRGQTSFSDPDRVV